MPRRVKHRPLPESDAKAIRTRNRSRGYVVGTPDGPVICKSYADALAVQAACGGRINYR